MGRRQTTRMDAMRTHGAMIALQFVMGGLKSSVGLTFSSQRFNSSLSLAPMIYGGTDRDLEICETHRLLCTMSQRVSPVYIE